MALDTGPLPADPDAGGPPADPADPADPGHGDDGGGAPGPPPWTGWKVAVVVVVALVAGGFVGAAVGERWRAPAADSVDAGFLADMRSHHQQAVEMANVAATAAGDRTVRDFAREVLVAQQFEVGYMEALLEEWGHFPPDADRRAMGWMGMPVAVDRMPGMQSEEQMARLAAATGAEADALFLQMMTAHHRGGVHMADDAAERAGDPRVRALAERMAATQRSEIAEYRLVAERLGVDL